MDDKTAIYLNVFCQQIQQLDSKIRFVGLADYAGKLAASHYRMGLSPLMDKKETEQYAVQTVFRARTRSGFKPQLGEQRYAVAVYEKLIRITITIAHAETEHHNMYLLVSMDIGSEYPAILEGNVLPFISRNKVSLFQKTRIISSQYED